MIWGRGKSLAANVGKFYVFVLLFWMVFWQPIIVLFWLDNGVTLTQVFLIKSAHGALMLLAEVPSGALADRYGKRKILFLATVAGTASLSVYLVGDNFYYFLVAEMFAAVGTSLISGADSAFVHDTLYGLGRADDFTQVMGKAGSFRFISQALSSAIGGFIGAMSYRLTFAASLLTTIPCVFVTLSMKEPSDRADSDSPPRRYLDIVSDSLGVFRNNVQVRLLALYMALLVSMDLMVLWSYQPYMQESGLPIELFGVAYMVFNLTAAGASRYAANVQALVGANRTLAALPVILLTAVLVMASYKVMWAISMILLLQIVRGMRVPLIYKAILDRISVREKATVLSGVSLLGRLFFIILSPMFGWAAENWSLDEALSLLGLVGLLGFAVLLGALRRSESRRKASRL